MGLERYWQKRHFDKTPEPRGGKPVSHKEQMFVIQKHAATRLHYDFRLELDGVLKSWAVPKGPSLDPQDKRLAVHVEDHPIEYGDFEGVIPPKQYGGGTVLLWDRGTWNPIGDAHEGYRKGKLKFHLNGEKLRGAWSLVRMHNREDDKDNWLLVKEKDEVACSGTAANIVEAQPNSVASGREMAEIAAAKDRVWHSNKGHSGEAVQPVKKGRASAQKKEQKPVKLDLAIAQVGRAKSIPSFIKPQLATLVDAPPPGEKWVHEVKLDGYRMLCRIHQGSAQFFTRRGNDWTHRFSKLKAELQLLPIKQAWLDGEIVVLKPDGTTSFQALQNALDVADPKVVYYLFDLLYLDGRDLTGVPLMERKRLLAQLLDAAGLQETLVRYSDHVEGTGEVFYQHACRLSLEGIISKRGDAAYQSTRSRDWLKVKCLRRQEFVIGGFTEPSGTRKGFGALLLGVYEDGKFVYAGKVGTGFNDALLTDLRKRMNKLERKTSCFDVPPPRAEARNAHWVKPVLVGEVQFSEWTDEGVLRHPSFQGLREDKDPMQIIKETPLHVTQQGKLSTEAEEKDKKSSANQAPAKMRGEKTNSKEPAGKRAASEKGTKSAKPDKSILPDQAKPLSFKITNPDRILYPEQGITKRELVLYYEAVADWILPHLLNRPLSLVRCPSGYAKECFFQKHANENVPEAIERIKVREKGVMTTYMVVNSLEALIGLVQMGVLEIHTWGSMRDDPERPNRIIWDLDPDVGLAWKEVVDAARLVRARLSALGLESFVKNTGGKGLHVVTPIVGSYTWDEIKTFSKAVAEDLVRANPKRFTANMAKAKRTDKIFIDYLRNGKGATAIAAYSTRAKENAPVSVPLTWDELSIDVPPNYYNIRNLPARLKSLKHDPWKGYAKLKQSITVAMKCEVGLKNA